MRTISFSMIQVVTVAALSLVSSSPAIGGIIADRITWVANTNTVTDYDFGVQAAGTTTTYNTAGGLNAAGLNFAGIAAFSGSPNFKVAAGSGSLTPWFYYGTGAVGVSDTVVEGFALPKIRITFTGGPVTAFAMDISANLAASILVTPQVIVGTTVTTLSQPAAPNVQSFVFYGITSTTGFSYIDITPQTANAYAIIDNISYGTAGAGGPPPSETPEVTTILSVAAGLFVLAYRRKEDVGMQAA